MSEGFMGKFFKAVESFGEDPSDDVSRDKAIHMHQMLGTVLQTVDAMYTELKGSTDRLHEGYTLSKSQYNLFLRYMEWKRLVKDVLHTDAKLRDTVKLPEQRDLETPLDYSMKVAAVLQRDVVRTKLTSEQVGKKYAGRSGTSINKENSEMQYAVHRTLKKYFVLRSVVEQLYSQYEDSKDYPIVPRYTMIKSLIKDMFRNPRYIELMQEDLAAKQ